MVSHGFLPLLLAGVFIVFGLLAAHAHNGVRCVEWTAFGAFVLLLALVAGATPTDLVAVAAIISLAASVVIGVGVKLEGARR